MPRDIHIGWRVVGGPARIYTIATPDGVPVRVMQVGSTLQGATFLDEARMDAVFAYHRSFDRCFDCGIPTETLLMLGGGGFAYPKHAMKTHAAIDMDVVEIDEHITALARKFFFLDELERACASDAGKQLRVITDDGRHFLNTTDRTYDVIINDAFTGKRPVARLLTKEALIEAKKRLNPGGRYLVNVVAGVTSDDVDVLQSVVATAAEVFDFVHVLPCFDDTFGEVDNTLVLASDARFAFDDEVPFPEELYGPVITDASIAS